MQHVWHLGCMIEDDSDLWCHETVLLSRTDVDLNPFAPSEVPHDSRNVLKPDLRHKVVGNQLLTERELTIIHLFKCPGYPPFVRCFAAAVTASLMTPSVCKTMIVDEACN